MKFALFHEIPVARPWTAGKEQQAIVNVVDQAVAGEQAGFDSMWTVEHHFLEEFSHCSNPEVLYGAVAAGFYTDVLGCELVHEEEDSTRSSHSLFFAIGDTLIELAEPTSEGSELARHLEAHGPIVYAFTFRVADLQRVVAHARDHEIGVIQQGSHTVELDPADTFGAVYGFTERELPGHPGLGEGDAT